jgi:hypothetical protein
MATDEDVADGLVNWINSLEISSAVSSVTELTDGVVIWKALRAQLYHRSSRRKSNTLQNG